MTRWPLRLAACSVWQACPVQKAGPLTPVFNSPITSGFFSARLAVTPFCVGERNYTPAMLRRGGGFQGVYDACAAKLPLNEYLF